MIVNTQHTHTVEELRAWARRSLPFPHRCLSTLIRLYVRQHDALWLLKADDTVVFYGKAANRTGRIQKTYRPDHPYNRQVWRAVIEAR